MNKVYSVLENQGAEVSIIFERLWKLCYPKNFVKTSWLRWDFLPDINKSRNILAQTLSPPQRFQWALHGAYRIEPIDIINRLDSASRWAGGNIWSLIVVAASPLAAILDLPRSEEICMFYYGEINNSASIFIFGTTSLMFWAGKFVVEYREL
jgi:hypothetical protein